MSFLLYMEGEGGALMWVSVEEDEEEEEKVKVENVKSEYLHVWWKMNFSTLVENCDNICN